MKRSADLPCHVKTCDSPNQLRRPVRRTSFDTAYAIGNPCMIYDTYINDFKKIVFQDKYLPY